MFIEDGKINDKLSLTIGIKYNQIKRDFLPNLEVDHFVDYLFKYKWKKRHPQSFSEAVSEIMNADVEHMVVYLSNDAIVSSKDRKLSDFEDLFGR